MQPNEVCCDVRIVYFWDVAKLGDGFLTQLGSFARDVVAILTTTETRLVGLGNNELLLARAADVQEIFETL